MNTAKLELCKELYELSGWDETYFCWRPSLQPTATYEVVRYIVSHEPRPVTQHSYGHTYEPFPAYDLGYLMRKLPYKVKNTLWLRIDKTKSEYAFGYIDRDLTFPIMHIADTPENAACKLAIELFKQGVLK